MSERRPPTIDEARAEVDNACKELVRIAFAAYMSGGPPARRRRAVSGKRVATSHQADFPCLEEAYLSGERSDP